MQYRRNERFLSDSFSLYFQCSSSSSGLTLYILLPSILSPSMHRLRLVVYPIIYFQGLIHPNGGCLGFLNHQQYLENHEAKTASHVDASMATRLTSHSQAGNTNFTNFPSHTIHVWYTVYVPTFGLLIFMVNVGI